MSRLLSSALFLALAAPLATAQVSMPPNQVTNFKDTSMLKPPAGAKVAVIEWEDLECPACSRAFPVVHSVIKQYNVPLIRRDFQIPGHIWSHEAALYARYAEDKVGAEFGTDYRRQVFASQYRIASQDDLKQFTQQYFSSHGKQLPFVIDPTGSLQKEIDADNNVAMKLGLAETPTIIVVTPKGWIQVKEVTQLSSAIDKAEDMMKGSATSAPAHKPATPVKKSLAAH